MFIVFSATNLNSRIREKQYKCKNTVNTQKNVINSFNTSSINIFSSMNLIRSIFKKTHKQTKESHQAKEKIQKAVSIKSQCRKDPPLIEKNFRESRFLKELESEHLNTDYLHITIVKHQAISQCYDQDGLIGVYGANKNKQFNQQRATLNYIFIGRKEQVNSPTSLRSRCLQILLVYPGVQLDAHELIRSQQTVAAKLQTVKEVRDFLVEWENCLLRQYSNRALSNTYEKLSAEICITEKCYWVILNKPNENMYSEILETLKLSICKFPLELIKKLGLKEYLDIKGLREHRESEYNGVGIQSFLTSLVVEPALSEKHDQNSPSELPVTVSDRDESMAEVFLEDMDEKVDEYFFKYCNKEKDRLSRQFSPRKHSEEEEVEDQAYRDQLLNFVQQGKFQQIMIWSEEQIQRCKSANSAILQGHEFA